MEETMRNLTAPRDDNKWDQMLETIEAQGQWILVATSRGMTKSGGGVYIKPHRDVFSRVVSVGKMVTRPIEKGEFIMYKEGTGALPEEYKEFPSLIYTFVYELHIIGKFNPDTKFARHGDR